MTGIELLWEQQDGDGSICKICEQVILGDMWQAFIKVGPTGTEKIDSLKLCDSCYKEE